MSGINKVILIGHLGKDPEMRYLEGGVSVTSFPLATSETFNKDGQKVEQTEWHNIVMWRGLADVAAKFLQKGKLVYIEGKLRTRSFEDKEGIKRYTTEIVAENFTMLGRKSDFEPDGNSRQTGKGPTNRDTFHNNTAYRRSSVLNPLNPIKKAPRVIGELFYLSNNYLPPGGQWSFKYWVNKVCKCNVVPSPSNIPCERLGYDISWNCLLYLISSLISNSAFL